MRHLFCSQFIYIPMVLNSCKQMKNYFNWFFSILLLQLQQRQMWYEPMIKKPKLAGSGFTHSLDVSSRLLRLWDNNKESDCVCIFFFFPLFFSSLYLSFYCLSHRYLVLSLSLSPFYLTIYIFSYHTLYVSLYHRSINHSLSVSV